MLLESNIDQRRRILKVIQIKPHTIAKSFGIDRKATEIN
jgi:hypothetical protein